MRAEINSIEIFLLGNGIVVRIFILHINQGRYSNLQIHNFVYTLDKTVNSEVNIIIIPFHASF